MYTITFGTYSFPNQTFEVTGFPISQNIAVNEVIQKDGNLLSTPFVAARRISVAGQIYADDKSDAIDQANILFKFMLSKEKQEFQHEEDKFINMKVNNVEMQNNRGVDKRVFNTFVDFVTDEPYFQATGASNSIIRTVSGGTITFDVVVEGDVTTDAILYFFPIGFDSIDDFRLFNLSNNNRETRFRGTVLDGTTLKVDATDLSVTNNTVDGITDFEGWWLRLVNGTNTINVVGSTGNVEIEWKDRYWL